MTDSVILECSHRVLTVTLNRPDAMNTYDRSMITGLEGALAEIHSRDDVRAVVLTGAGKVFSAGADVSLMCSVLVDYQPDVAASFVVDLHAALLAFHRVPVPVVCAINGACAGGALGLALCCDITWASETATFRGAFIGIGLTPDTGTSYFLPRAVGDRVARELLLTNRRVSAEEALRLGIVSRVLPAATLLEEATALARKLAAGSTSALVQTRAILDAASRNDLESHLEMEKKAVVARFETSDFAEGVAAFLEKRRPMFG